MAKSQKILIGLFILSCYGKLVAQTNLIYKEESGYKYFNDTTINLNLCFFGDYIFNVESRNSNFDKFNKKYKIKKAISLFQGKTTIPPFIHVEAYLYQNINDFELFLSKIKKYNNLKLQGNIGYDTYSIDVEYKMKKGKIFYILISAKNVLQLTFWQNFDQELFEKEIDMIFKQSFISK